MCGIVGWSLPPQNLPPDETLTLFARSVRHRGPDDSGVFISSAHGIGLGHRRLSIIDLSAGSHQPMQAFGGQVVLSYNGELYNFRELRAELQSCGLQFSTSGDTEVVLQAYLHWGIAALDRFAGMFAIALWDARSQTLHLARDATGIKPLYWMAWRGGITFASEARAMQSLPGVQLNLRDASVAQYLEFGYVIENDCTIFQDVRKVLPGQRLEIRQGTLVNTAQFYSPSTRTGLSDALLSTRIQNLHKTMDQVVREHLIADVPVALLLSGGLDSSLVAAFAARHTPVETLTMAFEGASLDERPFARAVADYVGSRHQEVFITAEQVVAEATNHVAMFDDLFADWGTLTTRLLYRRARELGYKVVLVGEGADELFGGYDNFNVPVKIGPFTRFRLYQRYSGRRHGECRRLFDSVMGAYLESTDDAFDAIRLFESRQQLPNQYVMKVDKASMAEGVEARTPFLDRRIADIAYTTPRASLLADGENKHLLRQMARHYSLLPDTISGRTKYGSPLAADWMDTNPSIRKLATEHLLAPGSLTERYGLSGAMKAYLHRGRSGQRWPGGISIYRNLAWKLLLLELWGTKTLTTVNLSSSLSAPTAQGDFRRLSDSEVVPGLVSTIIPVHNRALLMKRAVESVLAQTYRPIEIIIVDDGSTDSTPVVAAALKTVHPDVVRVVHQTNAGPGIARQHGVSACRGEFVQFLDSDDRYLPNKASLSVDALRANVTANIAYSNFRVIAPDGSVVGHTLHSGHETHATLFPALLAGRFWNTNSPVYRRSFLSQIGPWPSSRQMEDWQFDALAGAAGAKLVHVNEFTSEQWQHDQTHLGQAWRHDTQAHAERVNGFLRVLELAVLAGVPINSPDMQKYCRTLFLEARWAAAAGLEREAAALLRVAERHATQRQWQFKLFRVAAALFGYRLVGRIADALGRTK